MKNLKNNQVFQVLKTCFKSGCILVIVEKNTRALKIKFLRGSLMIDFNNLSDEERKVMGNFLMKELESLWDYISNKDTEEDVLNAA